MASCQSCGFENPEGFRFCGSCGTALAVVCSSCGAEVPAGFRFCGVCGAPTDAEAAAAAAPREEMPSERRPVAVLFADLVGFSTLAEHLDPEELRQLMTDTFAELTAEVERREGVVEKFIGDAVMAIFGAPQAHEDDPQRAVEAALAMLEVVRRRSESTPTPLRLRIGVNAGLVVSGAVGDGTQAGVMGDAVNVAARLQQAAEPGEVVVSEVVWRRIRDAFSAEPAGALEIKGREQPVEAYRVGGRSWAPQRRQAPFVGRRDERSLLELLWSSVEKGNTHVVSVVGEPGVGKSRLVSEFAPRGAAFDLRVVCGGDRAFGPFLDLIERVLGGLPGDIEELKDRMARLSVDEEAAMLVGALLGLAGGPPVVRMADEQRKRQVFAGVWQFVLAATSGRPSLVILDDVHWADASSLELLGFLLERLSGLPLMLVLTYRPGFEQVERAVLRSSHTGIRLEPLSPLESVELGRGFLGVTELPRDLEELIAQRAEGNPFFIEELLQALLELQALAVVDGRAVLAKVEVEIPDTVQGTILARVDRLGPRARTVLQHAAVIGRSFSTELMVAVMGEDVGEGLEELARSQLLVSEGPDAWSFKHGLIQEVTYETLLLRQRRDLHRRVAEALEASAKDDPRLLEQLAEHFAEAEVPERARHYAVAAGDLASERMGFVEAKARYETALRLWGEGDRRGRLELLMRLGQAALLGGDSAAARSAFVEAASGWEQEGEVRQAGHALAILGRVYWVTGEHDRANEALGRAMQTLEHEGATAELVRAYVWASTLAMLDGHADVGMDLAKRGLEMADALELDWARSQLVNTLGACEIFEGDPNGVVHVREALELAERSGDAEALGRAYVNLPVVLGDSGELREAVQVCRRGREVMGHLGSPAFATFIAGNEAMCLVELGRYDEGEAICRGLVETERQLLGVPGTVNALGPLAMSLLRRGRYAEARRVLEDVMPLARQLGGGEFLSPILELGAELEAVQGNKAAARLAISESADVVFATTAVVHWVHVLASAVRVGALDLAANYRERVGDRARLPRQRAVVAEAEGALGSDLGRFRDAAEAYAKLEMPYDEALCRILAGELDRARELITRFGLADGPLGARLRAAES